MRRSQRLRREEEFADLLGPEDAGPPEGAPPTETVAPAPKLGVRSIATTGLFILAVLYTLYLARPFLLPVVLALLLTFLLRPLVRGLARLRIPEALGAALVMLAVLGTAGYGVYRLSSPAIDWMERAPRTFRSVAAKLEALKEPMEDVTRATQEVEKMTTVAEPTNVRTVELKEASLRDVLFAGTWGFLAGAVIVFTLGYFLLASGDLFLLKLVRVLPSLANRKKAVRIARDIERQVSTYLVTTTVINAFVGLAAGLAFWALDVPNPVLWAVVAGALNFVPYLGALLTVAILGFVGFLTFETPGQALLPAAAFFAINAVEANLLTPWVLGRRLELNPVMIFLGLTFWWWVWGIPGALLAVPMLGTFKLFCDHVEPLEGVGKFLER